MKTLRIKKKSGGYRIVVVPSAAKKRQLRAMIPQLQRIVRSVCDLDMFHGFAELRSVVTNASKHVGFQYSLSFDLKSFFDSVNKARHGDAIRNRIWISSFAKLWHEGVARQGLPTSPIVANIAAAPMMNEIAAAFNGDGALTYEHEGVRCQWLHAITIYADDITISFNSPDLIPLLKEFIPKVAKEHGFEVNEKKTHLQCAKGGRRIITGIAVDDSIHPTRDSKRKLRAAIHNLKHGKVKHFPKMQWSRYLKTCKHRGSDPLPKSVWLKRWLAQKVRGLEEWCSCKFPGVGTRSAERIVTHCEATEAMHELGQRIPYHEKEV